MEAESPSLAAAMVERVPEEVWLHVLRFLEDKEVLSVALVSRLFGRLTSDDSIWRERYENRYLKRPDIEDDAEANAEVAQAVESQTKLRLAAGSYRLLYFRKSSFENRLWTSHEYDPFLQLQQRLALSSATSAAKQTKKKRQHPQQTKKLKKKASVVLTNGDFLNTCLAFDREVLVVGTTLPTNGLNELQNLYTEKSIGMWHLPSLFQQAFNNNSDSSDNKRDEKQKKKKEKEMPKTTSSNHVEEGRGCKGRLPQRLLRGHTDGVYDILVTSPPQTWASSTHREEKAEEEDRENEGNAISEEEQEERTSAEYDGMVLSASRDGNIKRWNWNAEAGQFYCSRTLMGHENSVYRLVYLGANSGLLFSGSKDKTIKLWSVDEERPLSTLRDNDATSSSLSSSSLSLNTSVSNPANSAHKKPVVALAWDDHHHQLCSGSTDGTIKIWDGETNACLQKKLKAHKRWLNGLQTLTVTSTTDKNGGAMVHSLWSNGDKGLFMWDLRCPLRKPLRKIKVYSRTHHVTCFQMDENKIVTGGASGAVHIYDLCTGSPINKIKAHKLRINALQFENTKLVTASSDKKIKVWEFGNDRSSSLGLSPHPPNDDDAAEKCLLQ